MKPKHTPAGDRPGEDRQLASGAPVRQFVGREEFVAPVQAALQEPQRREPLVLVYYGGAGIGKSRLRRELVRQLARDPVVLTATLDFSVTSHRLPETALFFLRKTLRETQQVHFPSFDLAHAILWQKAHPESPLGDDVKPLLEPGSLLPQLVDDSGKLPLIGLIPNVSALVGSRQHVVDRVGPTSNLPPSTYYLEWWEKRGERELEDLPQMEPGALVDQLPTLWAADLKDCLGATSHKLQTSSKEPVNAHVPGRKAVLFIDAYEQLWETGSSEADLFKRDEWVRELVKQLPEVLWIICGRQKLRWEEVEKEWDGVLSQHELGALPEKPARRFLESCDITDEQQKDAIVKGSQGVPHYLNLAADALQNARGKSQNAEFGGGSPEELVEQFTQQLDKPEVETLKVLSAARFWYYGLFENLINQYQTGYPATGYDDLARFSFIKDGAEPGTRTMHDLMREALQEHQAPELRKRVHLFLHEYYAKQLEGLDVKNISEKHKAALNEAFYHGRHAKNAEELWSWFETTTDVFNLARQHRLLMPLLREIVQPLETDLGPAHPSVVRSRVILAEQLCGQGEYAEAEPYLRRALAIEVKNLEANIRTVAPALDYLGAALHFLGRDAEAESLQRRWLRLSEDSLGPDHVLTVRCMHNLGNVLREQGRYAEAEPLLRRTLAVSEKTLGPDHRGTVLIAMNLISVLMAQGRYAEAEPLLLSAIATNEEKLGPDHWDTATALHAAGILRNEQGRYAEADGFLRRALEIKTKLLGPEHAHTFGTLESLGVNEERRGRYAEAESLYRDVLEKRERVQGSDNPATANTASWLAGICCRDGRYAEAETLYRRALAIREKALGPDHPSVSYSLKGLAKVCEQTGRTAEAEALYRRALAIREKTFGPDHPLTAETLEGLANVCEQTGRAAEAQELSERAKRIRAQIQSASASH